MPLSIVVNGLERELAELEAGATLAAVVEALALQPDRIAIEHAGEIAPRRVWSSVRIATGDKLEIVHFVGGGLAATAPVVRAR